jgi:ribosomal protein L11 methyltransferase
VAGPWSELSVIVPQALGDELLAWFAGESLGAWSCPDEGGLDRLRIFFESKAQAETAARRARALIETRNLDAPCGPVEVRDVRDGRWLERYQATLRPFPFAERFVICPSGEASSGDGRIPIKLVPGRAFGTGEHPTTRLSASLLERRVRPGERWLDLGCGTGILSLIAVHCGAARVLAADIDPEAVVVAREILAANRGGDQVETRCASAAELPDGWDGVVVNILASFFRQHAAELVRLVVPGGTVLASGFLADELEEVEAVLARHGLQSVERADLGEWRACAFIRRTEGAH